VLNEDDQAFLRELFSGERTDYRGRAEFLRNYQPRADLSKAEAAASNLKRWNKVQERVEEGKAAGPYPRPPFPNKNCPHQAIVVRQFTVPKNQWNVECEAVRIITNGSFPRSLATNDITPRGDNGVEYWSFSKFIDAAASLGSGCWVVLADAIDAYKIFGMAAEDLHQQVKMVQDPSSGEERYFVDLTPTFGGTFAADKWNRFAKCLTLVWRAKGADFNFFVDNFDQLVKTKAEAGALMTRLKQLAEELQLPLHEHQVAQVFKHLGWSVDLVNFSLSVPPERLEVVLEGLKELQQARSPTIAKYESLMGLFTWLAQVVFWARPALGHMRRVLKGLKVRAMPTVYIATRARSAAAWMEAMFRKTGGTVPLTSLIIHGEYNRESMCWTGDPACITAWADANLEPESRWGRAGLIATPGEWQGLYFNERWTVEQIQKICTTESNAKASPRAELWNILATAWEIHRVTGACKICIVNDCSPALKAMAKAYSDTKGMQDILDVWLPKLAERGVMVVGVREGRERLMIVDLLARGQVRNAQKLLTENWDWSHGLRTTRA
jgi:hypothetical protein